MRHSSGPRAGVSRWIVALGAAMTLVAMLAPAAFAHTELVSASPEPDSTLKAAPDQVRLGFSEALQAPGYLVVTAPSGAKLSAGEATIDKTELSAPVTLTETGVYTVAYRVVSADGHPVSGQYEFTLASAASPTSSPSAAESSGAAPAAEASASTETAPATRAASDADKGEHTSFWVRHGAHVGWGLAFLVMAGALVVFERRRHS